MTTFRTQIDGIPCQCEVTYYSAPVAMRITGTGFGDADPPEPEEFEFRLLTPDGDPAPELHDALTEDDESRLLAEYLEGR